VKLKRMRPSLRLMVQAAALGVVLFIAGLFIYNQSRFQVQDALFMAGVINALLFLIRIVACFGLFDLFGYGYNKLMPAQKQHKRPNVTFYEYTSQKPRILRFENLLAGIAFIGFSFIFA
jgi:hypothetical protein